MQFRESSALSIFIVALLCLLPGCRKPKPVVAPAAVLLTNNSDWIDENNHGVGLMGQFDFDAAARMFQPLVDGRSDRPDVEVNWGIAILNRRGDGDSARAQDIFKHVLTGQPTNLRAIYCTGLLLLNDGKPAEAITRFREVATADPADAYAAYFTGQCLGSLNKSAEASVEYERAIQLDPLLRSAFYGDFQALQQLGKSDQATARLAEFQRLTDDPRARLAEFKYTRMGKKSEAIAIDVTQTISPPAPSGPLFADAAPLKILNGAGVVWRHYDGSGPRPTITAADIDGDGKLDLFITSAIEVDGQIRNAVLLQRDDGFELDLKSPLSSVTDINAAVWGDFDNDGLVDVYLCRHGSNQLFRQVSRGKWQDITESAHASGGNFNTIDAAAVDADHDGDLDLFLVRGDGPTELLNNNLDGTFSAIGEKAGIAGDGRPATGLVVADLNHDGLVDLMVVKSTPPNEVFINDGIWKYHRDAKFDLLQSATISSALAVDVHGNGQVSVLGVRNGAVEQWRPDMQGVWRTNGDPMHVRIKTTVSATQPTFPLRGPIALADVAGEGDPHLILSTWNSWTAIPLAGDESSIFFPADLAAWAAINLDPVAGPSIVGLPTGGNPPLVWKPGPGRFPFAALSLSGKQNKPDSMRSNASGIGVSVAGRVDSHWSIANTYRTQSGPGQSLQPISLGVGPHKQLDFVRLIWPDGLQQTELNVPAGKLTHISEIQRQTSSCPVIFAWDGTKYSFITDCLGGGGIGFATGPGEYAPQRPIENVAIPQGLLREIAGRMVLKIGEPMEEACYLDSASLVSYDLPPGWMMTLDERMAINDPQPTGQIRFYRKLLLPSHAVNDRGEDITQAVTKTDGIAAEPGARDSRFIGFTKEHFVEMTFDAPIDRVSAGSADARAGTGTAPPSTGVRQGGPSVTPTSGPVENRSGPELLLLADGWIEYPYSQTMFAAWQAKAPYRAPTLEACGSDGKWVVVLEQFGYPAGMPRQMSIAIPRTKLPAGANRLRLRTDQEIYWDRLALAWAEPCPHAVRHVLPLKSAKLADVGFPFRTTGPQRQPHYDYAHRLPLWDTRPQSGWYTAFGPVDELLQSTDDACVIFGPGEEVELQYESPGQAPTSGWNRNFVLELTGWCKDRDLYTKDGRTLEPLPERDGATPETRRKRDELYRKYNTRWAQ